MIELTEQYLRDFARQSSKGNQLKWEYKGIWYKADYAGYEGLAEYLISKLLIKSSLDSSEFIDYNLEEIKYKRNIFNGVSSVNFVNDGYQLITLERLYKMRKGASLLESVWHHSDVENRLKYFVDEVVQLTGLDDFGKYISKMLTIDAFFLNEDRHMHNIAVLMGPGSKYEYCPIFDNGAGLLSDLSIDYPLSGDVIEMIDEVKAKTICTSFDEQLDAVESAFGYNIHFNFHKKDVDALLEDVANYSPEIIERVRTILYQRIRKFDYLMH
ncbi:MULTISPECIES: hypothetical protein [Pseudobutyrivibrio]|uniref:HipA-like C-terminal domain-containing protein n=1 Tax=Pseudobutyrivibrio xylanivorans TaxID=185007 RepID=A0A1G5S2I3_PSEXY|nr:MULTISPECIES: hypothetical protein [Pseudobutyrivibrio]MDC7278756.1 hypothetical protein [Butyrivibrio fibrisolvens]SCZ79779.1 hypothetical protein SAMN02910350_01967 [Pseudobutyrivibrio xylanivorans]